MSYITYKDLTNRIEAAQRIKAKYDLLIEAGVPKSKVHLFQLPSDINSGYSMGEVVRVTVNGKEVYRLDYRKEYGSRCKYHAKHGYIEIAFNKKQLREFIGLCVELNRPKPMSQQTKAVQDWHDYAESHIDRKHSTIKHSRP